MEDPKRDLPATGTDAGDGPRTSWNELQFLSWDEFQQMTPTILLLEVRRLEGLMRAHVEDTEFYNQLIRTRFAVNNFIDCVRQSRKEDIEESCGGHLRTAIMSLSIPVQDLDTETQDTVSYILDRLKSLYQRIGLIY